MKFGKHLLYGIAGLLACNAGYGSDIHEQMRLAVVSHLEGFYPAQTNDDDSWQRVEITVGYIDPRITLPGCSQTLETSLNANQRPVGKLSVKVQCAGDRPWSKYVAAEVHVYAPVLVATNGLPRGTLLSEQDFEFIEMDLASIRRTPIAESDLAIGLELKQAVAAGTPITREILKKPKVIKKGDLIQILAETGNITIRQQGEALQDGELGGLINVRNSSSRLVIQAKVIGQGQVKILL